MRILFMTTALDYSGAPKMLSWVANRMAEKGHEVHLVAFFSDEQARKLDERIMFHALGASRDGGRLFRNTIGMLNTISKLHKTVRAIRPDVVISFLDSVGLVYLPVGRLFTKCKFVVSERADPNFWGKKTAGIRSWLMGFAHGTVFQTTGAQRYFQKHKGIYADSTVIPNPVIIQETLREKLSEYQHSYADRDNRIVTVGRLSLRQKRQDVLLDAFGIVHTKHPELKLVIYGDGENREKIRSLTEEKGLADCVLLAGKTSQVERDICSARAFVLTSDYEGIPNALIEAMTVGVPCVSTDCSPGGAALLLRDGENGFLVPCGDAEAVADRLLKVVEDPQIADQFATEGPKISGEFSENRIADLWEQYIECICRK